MEIIYSANDYKILFTLAANKCCNEMKAFTIKKISENTKLSVPKIRLTLQSFKREGYISEGVKHHSAKTYYVNENGLEKIKELKGDNQK